MPGCGCSATTGSAETRRFQQCLDGAEGWAQNFGLFLYHAPLRVRRSVCLTNGRVTQRLHVTFNLAIGTKPSLVTDQNPGTGVLHKNPDAMQVA